ncbi:NAD(P)-dependent oxidoreductase [Nocardiopsis sp. RV163]|uniref:NAD-dependent epimerase/dehydratase family protein n=1 Tax=Nocardiopsis sp. RV163 TaxID=1661388 RepID=UPI00064B8234|nr:NAD(P)-dependent oxidoreductase [Nocardiopsis sp. RV163]
MRVLVTGGSGRLGRSVVAALAARGHQVTSVDTAAADLPEGVDAVTADLLDPDALEAAFTRASPEAVVHLAGIAVPFARPDVETLQVNTGLAWAVLSAAVAHGAHSAVAASSPTVYGYNTPSWAPSYLPLDEAHPVAPWHAYGLSKAIIEDTVRALARTSATCVLSCVRPGYVVAPEEWEGAPTQLGHTMAERLADPALAATSLFNYVDARDAAELFALVIENPAKVSGGQVFNAMAPDPLSEAPVDALLPLHHPGTGPAAAALADGRAVFSSQAARAALGWAPSRTWRTQLRTGRSRAAASEAGAAADGARGASERP